VFLCERYVMYNTIYFCKNCLSLQAFSHFGGSGERDVYVEIL